MVRLIRIAILSSLHLASSEIVSITRLPAYASQRPCAKLCWSGGIFTAAGVLANAIGCDSGPPENECVCRLDLQDDADGYLSSCVSNECDANTLDINSAVSIYDTYCTAAGYIQSTPATTTSDTSTSAGPSETQTSGPTGPTSSNSGNAGGGSNGGGGGGNALGTGDIVGIVIGVLGFIATAISTWFAYKAVKNKKSRRDPPHVERDWRY
ncbi:hypothetical protein F4777DRAFT_565114 [Nemania sp. FL0916]|nr:hypothetical protein F4777DRAFT_565114 [Nemania sp. FL0916]